MQQQEPVELPIDLTPLAVSMFGAPLYFLEFVFVGLPMLIMQGVVLIVIYTIYDLLPLLGQSEFSYHKVSDLGDLKAGLILFLLPFAFSLVVTLVEFIIKRKINLTWKHRFAPLAILDTIVYAAVAIFFAVYGLFSDVGGGTALLVFILMYILTIFFTFLHFYLKDKIYNKVTVKLTKQARLYQESQNRGNHS